MNKLLTVAALALSAVITPVMNTEGGSGSAGYAQQLPRFSLPDPNGKKFTNQGISRNGVVLVVTAPTLDNKSNQENWSVHLLKAKAGSKARLVYLEDLQPSVFKDEALAGMQKDYRPGKDPLLLVDQSGKVRKALKVPNEATVVLVYNSSGKLVHSDAKPPSAQGAAMIYKKVK